jgi:diacylglycerol kinase (ATP)
VQITLIHNPAAGDGDHSEQELRATLEELGHEVLYASSKGGQWKAAVQEPGDLVVVAGGDGTVGKVARRLDSRVPFLPLPLGTANNLATALGMRSGWRRLLAGFGAHVTRPLDVGEASGPWKDRDFLEGAGFGLLAVAMRAAEKESDDDHQSGGTGLELRGDLQRLRDLLESCPSRPCAVEVDGHTEEQDAFLVAVMNIRSLGPILPLAPGARHDDGLLHVVTAGGDERNEMKRYLDARLRGEERPLLLPVRSGRSVRVRWPEPLAHIDDKLWKGKKGPVEGIFRCRAGALQCVVASGGATADHQLPT